jgi:hypothetical protein
MAVKATLYYDDGFVALNLRPDERRPKVGEDPDIPGYDPGFRLWFYWDDEKIAKGEYELLGIEINDIGWLRDEDLDAIDQLDLPRIDVAEAGLYDATASDVLRWARKTYPSRYTTASA